ncbi:MAG: L,D-transpeptidase family protein [Candidatus Promineifilaceae bacterium]
MAKQSQVPDRDRRQTSPVVRKEVWVPATHPNNQRQKWPSQGRVLLATVLFFLLGLTILVGLISTTLLFFYSDFIFPGARIANIPVGTMTTQQATAVLSERFPSQEILLVHSSGAWPVTVTDLGMTMDFGATVEQAYEIGRTIPGLRQVVSGNFEVKPVWMLDSNKAMELLERLTPEIGTEAVNASVVIQDGEAHAVPAREGLALDLEMTLDYLKANPTEVVQTGRLPLATQPVNPQIIDAEVYVSEAQRYLSKQVAIHAFDPILNETADWEIRPREWLDWLSLVVTPGELDPYSWVVDERKAQQYLATGWSWLGEQRYLDAEEIVPAMIDVITSGQTGIDARVYHQPVQHTVKPGESYSSIGYTYGIPYPWVQQANPGIETLAVGDVVTVPSADDMLPLPVVPNKRIVVSISQQHAWVYEDGELKWDWPISTGISSSPTSPGVFQIQSHESEAYAGNWDLYMPNFMGIYRPVPTSDFMNGFHGFPNRDGFNLLWTGDLGTPVTYGCILLSSENAQTLYSWAEDGVVVEIQR